MPKGIDVELIREIPRDGWIERHERWRITDSPDPAVEMRSGYSLDGGYIGGVDDARHLVNARGLRPELADPDHAVCTIGFNPQRNEWAGWSHRAISWFPTRLEAIKFAESVASMEDEMSGKATASMPMNYQENDPNPDGNNLLLSGDNVLWRYDNMQTRRKMAALCGQYRVVQRLDKQINILRAALNLPPEPPFPTDSNGMVHRTSGEASPWDAQWMAETTARFVAKWTSSYHARGFAINRRSSGGVTTWMAEGADRSGPRRVELSVLKNRWVASVSDNGVESSICEANPRAETAMARSIPPVMAREGWDGCLTSADAQRYVTGLAAVLKKAGE